MGENKNRNFCFVNSRSRGNPKPEGFCAHLSRQLNSLDPKPTCAKSSLASPMHRVNRNAEYQRASNKLKMSERSPETIGFLFYACKAAGTSER